MTVFAALPRKLTQYVTGFLLLGAALGSQAEPLLNGLAPHMELGKERFIAGLYVDELSKDANALLNSRGQKRMELHVTTKRLSHRALKRMWIEGMAINTPSSQLTRYAKDTVAFASLFKSKLTSGDVITISSDPETDTTLSINGVELGSFHTEGFFNVLLRTWIGSVPLSSDFRKQLLQAGDANDDLLARYEAISPSAARVAAIKDWSKPPAAPAAKKPEVLTAAKPDIGAPAVSAPSIAQAPTPTPAPAPAASAVTKEAEPVVPEEALAQAAPKALPQPEEVIEEAEEEEYEEEEPLLTAESLVARQLYQSSLLKWTYRYLSYPQRAIQRAQEGSVRMSVTINRMGEIQNVLSIEESKFSLLNREANRALKKAEPFPAMPEAVAGDTFTFTMPIVFRLPK